MTFNAAVRDELAQLDAPGDCCLRSETATVLRLAGRIDESVPHGVTGWIVSTTAGQVARRVRGSLQRLLGVRPDVTVVRRPGLRPPTRYMLTISEPVPSRYGGDVHPLSQLGLLADDGQPVAGLPTGLLAAPCDDAAVVRGALLATGSISDPRREAHLEFRVDGSRLAGELATILRAADVPASVASHHGGTRVVVKSGQGIAVALTRAGAHGAYLRWDGERLRRELRGAASRSANADRANLGRAAAAAAGQTEQLRAALESPGWWELPDTLREVGLARIANPEATLAELAQLLEPPVAKVTVHRRLARLTARLGGVGGDDAARHGRM